MWLKWHISTRRWNLELKFGASQAPCVLCYFLKLQLHVPCFCAHCLLQLLNCYAVLWYKEIAQYILDFASAFPHAVVPCKQKTLTKFEVNIYKIKSGRSATRIAWLGGWSSRTSWLLRSSPVQYSRYCNSPCGAGVCPTLSESTHLPCTEQPFDSCPQTMISIWDCKTTKNSSCHDLILRNQTSCKPWNVWLIMIVLILSYLSWVQHVSHQMSLSNVYLDLPPC